MAGACSGQHCSASCQPARRIAAVELPVTRGGNAPGRLIMAAPSYVFTIARVAEMLGEDEEWLQTIADDMEPEDGCLRVCGTDDISKTEFTPQDREPQGTDAQLQAGRPQRLTRRSYSPAVLTGWTRIGQPFTANSSTISSTAGRNRRMNCRFKGAWNLCACPPRPSPAQPQPVLASATAAARQAGACRFTIAQSFGNHHRKHKIYAFGGWEGLSCDIKVRFS